MDLLSKGAALFATVARIVDCWEFHVSTLTSPLLKTGDRPKQQKTGINTIFYHTLRVGRAEL